MLSAGALLFFIALLLAGFLLEPVAERLRIPISVVLVVLGYLGSEIVTGVFGMDTGIRWYNFDRLIFFVFLPILIFDAALNIDPRALWRDALPIFLLAVPLLVATIGVVAVIIYYAIDHPTGFPWSIALLSGAVLSATDPAAVTTLLRKVRAPERLVLLLEGESLFNDAAAVVLFLLLLTLAMPGAAPVSGAGVGQHFLRLFFGGIATGLAIGGATMLIFRYSTRENLHAFVTVTCAYSTYLMAEQVLGVSGVMATLSAGLLLSGFRRQAAAAEAGGFVNHFWSFAGQLTGYCIFLLAGVTITLSMFTEQWLAILFGIGAVLASRLLVIFGVLGPVSHIPGLAPIPASHQAVLTWGAVRGTMTMALALSLPPTLPGWYTVQAIAYGVVIFTLFVQATTMNPLVRVLRLTR